MSARLELQHLHGTQISIITENMLCHVSDLHRTFNDAPALREAVGLLSVTVKGLILVFQTRCKAHSVSRISPRAQNVSNILF